MLCSKYTIKIPTITAVVKIVKKTLQKKWIEGSFSCVCVHGLRSWAEICDGRAAVSTLVHE